MASEGDTRLEVTYRLAASAAEAENLARRIAFEQAVELPEAQVTEEIRANVVGRVEAVADDPEIEGARLATISYDVGLAGDHMSPLLNLLFGNVSLFEDVRLVDVAFPEQLTEALGGPRSGIKGLRALSGVYGRPLLATPLKPKGASVDVLADIARDFALGGGDIVKDDQNLADDFEVFKDRVARCKRAIDDANARSGRRCLYFPHLTAPGAELERYLDYVSALGVAGVLVCPMILGLETVRAIGRRYPLMLMAHPTFTGSFIQGRRQGIAPGVLLGTLFRLAGADISIVPRSGSRFAVSRAQCLSIRDRLLEPLGKVVPSCPAPGGGIERDTLAAMCADYGEDATFIAGAALQGPGGDVTARTRAFLDDLREHFEERIESPVDPA
jgi:ribulose-bisphosphate carboxylase large chain